FQSAPGVPEVSTSRTEAGAAAPAAWADWFATPVWRQSPADRLPKAPGRAAGVRWLLLADDQGLGAAMAERLTAAGDEVLKVVVGGRFARLSHRACALDPSRPDDWAALIALLKAENLRPDRIAHLWTVTARDMPISDASGLQRVRRFGFESLLLLLQAFGERWPDASFTLGVVTSHTHEIVGGDGRFPEKATVLGPVRVVRRERPAIGTRAIDVEAPSITAGWAAVAGQVIDEFDLDLDADLVAYRGGRRWTQGFEPVRLDADPAGASTPGLRPGGTYLVTGGLGGVGLSLAHWLAGRLRPKLVLTGRRGLPPREQWDGWMAAHAPDDPVSRQMAAVRALEAAGADVLVAAADVTDMAAMREVIDRAVRRFGPLAGVIHAAGVPGGGVLQLKTLAAADRVLAPKVEGMRVLDAVLKRHTPDFIALCSSVTSLVGEPGQIDYCAANAYLDAYAQSRSGDQLTRVVAIDWDAWRDVGMAAATPVPDSLRPERDAVLQEGISPADGGEAFARIIASRLSQVVVSPRLDRLRAREMPPGAAAAPAGVTEAWTRPQHPRPDLATAYRAPVTDVERRLAGVWEALLGVAGIGLDDHFFDLGGDSLLATQLISRLHAAFDVQVSLKDVLEHPTIAQLAAAIDPAGEQARLLAELEGMSDEEAEARLRELTRPPDA
ncbi:MAG TPA: SDR family NAD(P)-dependent oxidoreductase, partial [Vicinamibacterales bacterium]|nr:SDR family NAD(P)-dependent oxidoreductase [Vicinamibacterales bacterium]